MIRENNPKVRNVRHLPTRSLGSHSCLLIAILAPDKVQLAGDDARMDQPAKLLEAHKDIQLQPEELLKICDMLRT